MPTYPKKIALEGFGLLAKTKIGECIKFLSVILVKPLLLLDGDLLTKGQLQTLNYLLGFTFYFCVHIYRSWCTKAERLKSTK